MLDRSMYKRTDLDTPTIVFFILVAAAFAFLIYRSVWFGGMQQKTREYTTVVTYQTGEQDTLILRAKEYPRLYDTGCVYDHQYNTYICGVRKINILATNETH